MQQTLPYFYDWFHDYVKKFYSTDSNIQKNILLKEEHTLRVANHIRMLADSLALSPVDIMLAEVIGLFHDIGRFEQFTKYQTYRDGKSEDHARLGLKILAETKVLEKLEKSQRHIVEQAIAFHNVCNLPAETGERVLLFSKLIRDADKLDSMEVIINYFENKEAHANSALEDYPDTPEYSAVLIEAILANRNIKYSEIKTVNDMKLAFLAWFFDVNFTVTLQQMRDKQFAERIVQQLPSTGDIQKVYDHITTYIKDRINSKK